MTKKQDIDAYAIVDVFVQLTDRTDAPIYIGIDPGAQGGIGFLCDRYAAAISIPTFKTNRKRRIVTEVLVDGVKRTETVSKPGTKTEFNLPEIVAIFRLFNDREHRVVLTLEQGQVQVKGKGNNAYTGFRVGVGYALWLLWLADKDYRTEEVPPITWKKALGLLGKDKEHSRKKAMALWPSVPMPRKEDHNLAEALLLAFWARCHRGGV